MIKRKEWGANLGRRQPHLLPNRYIPSINEIPQYATVFFQCKGKNGKIINRTATGRQGQTLYCLCRAGAAGITAAEVSTWALRLGAYIFKLRHEYHLDIETLDEPNASGIGYHARYVLRSRVRITEIRKQ